MWGRGFISINLHHITDPDPAARVCNLVCASTVFAGLAGYLHLSALASVVDPARRAG